MSFAPRYYVCVVSDRSITLRLRRRRIAYFQSLGLQLEGENICGFIAISDKPVVLAELGISHVRPSPSSLMVQGHLIEARCYADPTCDDAAYFVLLRTRWSYGAQRSQLLLC